MPGIAPYYVVIDSNSWIKEYLMESAIGSALIHAVARTGSSIVLPEIVELEVPRVLQGQILSSLAKIKEESRKLEHWGRSVLVPTPPDAEARVKERWKQPEGSLKRMPFTFEQARAALQRIVSKAPPCGSNNEQFRDSCLWHIAVSELTDRTVHFITADTAFYDGKKPSNGPADMLRNELATTKRDVQLHPSIEDFLAAMGESASVDEEALAVVVTKAIADPARETANRYGFKLGRSQATKIKGYKTPKEGLIAISFAASFDLEVMGERRADGTYEMTLIGECSYVPATKEISQVEIRDLHSEMTDYALYGPGIFFRHIIPKPTSSSLLSQL